MSSIEQPKLETKGLKREKPQARWGAGATLIHGYGETDEQLEARGIVLDEPRGCRGFLHNDAQFAKLAKHLHIVTLSSTIESRTQLDRIRECYLRNRLYEAASTPQRDRNAALSVVLRRVKWFRTSLDSIAPLADDWLLVGSKPSEIASLFRIFGVFPKRLHAVAAVAREKSMKQGAEANRDLASSLGQLSAAAECLANTMLWLDLSSQADLRKQLPITLDYQMDSLFQIAKMTRRLEEAVERAVETGMKRRGPTKFLALLRTIDQLCELFEQCGGRISHTPRDKTEYDGAPHSPAGVFVAGFFKLSDPKLPTTAISSALAEVIEGRHAVPRSS